MFLFSDYGALLTEDGDFTPEYLAFQRLFHPDAGTLPALQRLWAVGGGGCWSGAHVVFGRVQLAPARFMLGLGSRAARDTVPQPRCPWKLEGPGPPESHEMRVSAWKWGEGAESEHACSPAGFQEILSSRAEMAGPGEAEVPAASISGTAGRMGQASGCRRTPSPRSLRGAGQAGRGQQRALHPSTGLGKEPASCLWFAEVPSFRQQDCKPKDTYAPLAAGHFISLWDTLIHQDDVSALRMDVRSGLGGEGNEHRVQRAVFAISVPSTPTVQIRRPRLLLSRSVVSDSLRPPWTAASQAPLSMGFSRQE